MWLHSVFSVNQPTGFSEYILSLEIGTLKHWILVNQLIRLHAACGTLLSSFSPLETLTLWTLVCYLVELRVFFLFRCIDVNGLHILLGSVLRELLCFGSNCYKLSLLQKWNAFWMFLSISVTSFSEHLSHFLTFPVTSYSTTRIERNSLIALQRAVIIVKWW